MILDLRALMSSAELDLSAFGAKSNRVWPGHPGCQKNVKYQGLWFNQQHSGWCITYALGVGMPGDTARTNPYGVCSFRSGDGSERAPRRIVGE